MNIRTIVPDLFKKLFPPPIKIPAQSITGRISLDQKDKEMLQRFGVTMSDLRTMMDQQTMINFDRNSLYRETDRAVQHWLVGAACELYADVVTTYSQLQNATVWITSENAKYKSELEKLLAIVGIEERIFDWAYALGQYGDLFVKLEAKDGVGIVSIDDGEHPINTSRVDYNGRLIGFYETPMGHIAESRTLLPPWDYVHFRILGTKKKRPRYADPLFSEYRTVTILSPDLKRVSTKYGTSLLQQALPAYKRLRLAEDSLLIARMSKGILRYIYKVKVDGSNIEAVSSIIDGYKTLLKRARALDINQATANFDEKSNPMGVDEDIIVPVWGDVNDLAIEKLGGETDIRWIKDIEELRNQCAAALRTPLQLLGGFTSELPGSLGQSAIERLDIRFARSLRRLQRGLVEGIKRMCQLHLSYMGMDPDPRLFEVNMPETSSAEEEELKDALDKGVDVVDKLTDMIVKFTGEDDIDKLELLNYMNDRILKLNDFDARAFLKSPEVKQKYEAVLRERKDRGMNVEKVRRQHVQNTDLLTFTPFNGGKEKWAKLYESVKVNVSAPGRPSKGGSTTKRVKKEKK